MNVVVMVSANAEWGGVKSQFSNIEIHDSPYGEYFQTDIAGWMIHFFHAGWGKTAAAGALQYVLDRYQPELVVNLGTCGGFLGTVQRGEVVLVERTFIYDIVEMMDSSDVTDYYATSLDLSWLAEPYPYPVRRGLLASADSDLLPEKISFLRSHGALAADWESASLAWVAQKNNTRLLILRAVSDLVNNQGGEVYGDIESFNERTREIMKTLVGQLPGWLNAVRI
jgi:adenosylhomocysteine nucleosidase